MRAAVVFCAFFACGMVAAQDTGSTGGGLAISIEQPTLAIRTMIRTQGTSNDSLGQIMMYAGSFPPTTINGWQPCAGQVLNITDNPSLYAAIGSAYGGDGTTTFALPDLRGRAAVGTGTGAGLSAWAQGQTRGAETVTLTTANLPSHAHTLPTSLEPSGTTLATGSGQAFGILQPSLGVRYVTPLSGYVPFPTGGFYGGADPVVGQVSLTARSAVPTGWAACDGSTLSIAGNSSVYAVMGTTYGGDGTTTFALPDLQGRAAIGQGAGRPGQVVPQTLGQASGVESIALTEAQLHANAPLSGVDVCFRTQPDETRDPAVIVGSEHERAREALSLERHLHSRPRIRVGLGAGGGLVRARVDPSRKAAAAGNLAGFAVEPGEPVRGELVGDRL